MGDILKELQARAEKKFPKISISSEEKAGKTHGVCGFPSPVLIDTEHGADYPQYEKMLADNGGIRLFTTDADEIIAVQKRLIERPEGYRTFVVDSFTVAYNALLDKFAESEGTEYGRHKVPADRKAKHLLTMALRMPMTVIFTNHIKDKWSGGQVSGKVHDSYNKLNYYFDIILELVRRGPDRIAMVRGSRCPQLPEGTEFPWSYRELASRMGRELFEGEVVPVELATSEQVIKIRELLDTRADAETLTEKWLKKAEAEDWSEMTKENIGKCITFLQEGKKEK